MTAALSKEDNTKRVLFSGVEEETPSNPRKEEVAETSTIESALKSTQQGLSLDSLSQDKYLLPQCQLPPLSELEPVETFVMNAIKSKHEESPDPAHVQGYKAIIDLLRRPTDPDMIRNVLISLRTAGNGTVLTMIATNPIVHAQLIHVVFRFFPGGPPKPPKHDEEENKKFEENIQIYNQLHVMDAHLHLMLALVSAKSAHLIPATTAVWKMLAMHATLQEAM
jgi:RNA polymerase I-specific transcription initiation factor RRN3